MALDLEVGSTQYATFAAAHQSLAGASICFRIKPETVGGADFTCVNISGSATNIARLSVRIRSADGVITASARRLNADSVTQVAGATVLSAGTTYSVVVVANYSGNPGYLRVYINAVRDDSSSTIAAWNGVSDSGASSGGAIGATAAGATPLDGMIQSVHFYQRELSPTEITEYHNTGKVSGAAPRNRWEMGTTSGTAGTITDEQGNANATAVGSPVYAANIFQTTATLATTGSVGTCAIDADPIDVCTIGATGVAGTCNIDGHITNLTLAATGVVGSAVIDGDPIELATVAGSGVVGTASATGDPLVESFAAAISGTSTADGKNLEHDVPPADPATDRFPYLWRAAIQTTRPTAADVHFLTRPSLVSYEVLSAFDTHQPGGRAGPDTSYNIDAALTWLAGQTARSKAYVVYLANDIGYAVNTLGFTLAQIVVPTTGYIDAELKVNYEALAARAWAAGVRLYISDGQPSDKGIDGNPITSQEITAREYARNMVRTTFPRTRVDACYLESYDALRDPDGTINDSLVLAYDSMHPNKAGHVVLGNVVLAAGLDATVHALIQGSIGASGVAGTCAIFSSPETSALLACTGVAGTMALDADAFSGTCAVAATGVAGTMALDADQVMVGGLSSAGVVGACSIAGAHVIDVSVAATGVAGTMFLDASGDRITATGVEGTCAMPAVNWGRPLLFYYQGHAYTFYRSGFSYRYQLA